MENILAFLTNVVFPLFTSLFLFIFFLYFIFTKPTRSKTYNCFTLFLISFSLYFIGRPVQILIGPHPVPLIINNFRIILLSAVSAPMIIFSMYNMQSGLSKNKRLLILGCGFTLGCLYTLFNSLGTKASYVFFTFREFIAYDNLTPQFQAPIYGREITILVQVSIGVMLSIISLHMLLKNIKINHKCISDNKLFLINTGVLLFGATLSIGSLVKQWWLYYSGSILSILLLGKGVLLDIKDLHLKINKLIPYLKETFLQDIAYSPTSVSELSHTLKLLEKSNQLDTFIVINIHTKEAGLRKKQEQIPEIDDISENINTFLVEKMGNENFIIFPISYSKIGLAISNMKSPDEGEESLFELLETVKTMIFIHNGGDVSIGIGRTYPNLEDLRQSYLEALNAQVYAQKNGNSIIHINNIRNTTQMEITYPYRERDRLLEAIRLGSLQDVGELCDIYFEKLLLFSRDNPSILRIRLLELLGSLTNTITSNGGEIKKLFELDHINFTDHLLYKNLNKVQVFFQKVIRDITHMIAKNLEDQSINIFQQAKTYIKKNYQQPLTVNGVAKAIFISPSYFLHMFKKQGQYTFIEYLTKVRLEKAKELLLNSDLSITEIAFKIGFNDSNYFSTVFKNHMQASPKTYRKKNRILKNSY